MRQNFNGIIGWKDSYNIRIGKAQEYDMNAYAKLRIEKTHAFCKLGCWFNGIGKAHDFY
jgi:hypothetical protein